MGPDKGDSGNDDEESKTAGVDQNKPQSGKKKFVAGGVANHHIRQRPACHRQQLFILMKEAMKPSKTIS